MANHSIWEARVVRSIRWEGHVLLEGKTVIVTGGNSGIGEAVVLAVAAEGANVVIDYIAHPDETAHIIDRIKASGVGSALGVQADVSKVADLQKMIDAAVQQFGRLDVLVNNGGVGAGATAGEHETKLVDMQLDVNLRSVVLMYREALGLLRVAGAEHGRAQVVNVASIAGKQPGAWLSVYSAAKAGVIAYTQAMNRELGEDGIRSVALCPGWVDTQMSDYIKGKVPAAEMIRPEDIAAAVRFVLSLSPAAVVPEIVFERAGGGF